MAWIEYDLTKFNLKYSLWDRVSQPVIKTIAEVGYVVSEHGTMFDTALDLNKNHHLIYLNKLGKPIYRLNQSSSEGIPFPNSWGEAASAVAMALDSKNNPQVAVINRFNSEIFLGKKESGSWRVRFPNQAIYANPFNNFLLKVDFSGNYHVFYENKNDFLPHETIIDPYFRVIKDSLITDYERDFSADIWNQSYAAFDSYNGSVSETYLASSGSLWQKQLVANANLRAPGLKVIGDSLIFLLTRKQNSFNLDLFTSVDNGKNWNSTPVFFSDASYSFSAGPVIGLGRSGVLYAGTVLRNFWSNKDEIWVAFSSQAINPSWSRTLFSSVSGYQSISGLKIQSE